MGLLNNRFMVLIDPLADFDNKTRTARNSPGSNSAPFRAVLSVRAYAGSAPEKRGETFDPFVRPDASIIEMSTSVIETLDKGRTSARATGLVAIILFPWRYSSYHGVSRNDQESSGLRRIA